MKRLLWWYAKLLHWCTRRRWIILIVPLSMLLTAVFSFCLLPKRFLPVIPSKELCIDIEFPSGTLFKTIKETGQKVSAAVYSLPEIKHITALAGREDHDLLFSADPEETEAALHIRVSIAEKIDFSIAYRAVLDSISDCGVSAKPAPPDDALASLLGVSEQTAFLVTSSGAESVESNAAAILSYLDSQGISSAAYPAARQEEIQVLPLRKRLAKTGITVEKLGGVLSSLLRGSNAGSMWIDGEEYPVRVYSGGREKDSVHTLSELPLQALQGGIIHLGSISEIKTVNRTSALFRSGKKDAKLIKILEEPGNLEKADDPALLFPHIVSRETSLLKEEASAILITFIAALALLYLVLSAQFESFKEPLIILSSIPLSAAGTGLILLLTGGTFNVQSALALLVLFGLAVNNAILLRDRMLSSAISVIRCAQERLRPISITALSTIAALIPTAGGFFGPTPQQDLAIAIIGGLSLSTFTTLLLIPLFSMRGIQGT